MVPNLTKGVGIKGTALYVLHDKRTEEERAIGAELTPEHQTTHRIGMTATRNLSTDDPELAWRLMCATANARDALKEAAGVRAGGRQTKNFCGHLSLSWEHQTKPDAAEMQRAADGALKALGWEKLQALIVEHRDEEHAHCHIVVNLIDPETGRTAPNRKNDYELLQRWAHEYDRERGIEACPERAKRMDRAADDPTPPKPRKRWLSRKDYEQLQATERAEHREAAMGRYREAAAEVRERFRPEWAAHYKQVRAEQRALDRDQAALLRGLDRACDLKHRKLSDAERSAARGIGTARESGLVDFYNAHRETIWKGIADDQHPGNTHTLLTPAFLKAAIERAHEAERADMAERHGAAKEALQARHTEARQEAYRAAWQRPQEPAADRPTASVNGDRSQVRIEGAGATRVIQGGKPQTTDPERDLAEAAERIDRQRPRAANGNVDPEQRTERAGGGGGGGRTKPDDELEALRRRIAARDAERREQARVARERFPDFGPERRRD